MRLEEIQKNKIDRYQVIVLSLAETIILAVQVTLLCLLTSVVLANEIEEIAPEQMGLSSDKLIPINK